MNTARPPFEVLDLLADNGRALRRGYLELTLDKYYGTDLPNHKAENSALLLHLYKKSGSREHVEETRSYATNIPDSISEAARSKIITRLADKLVNDFGVSAFTDNLENHEPQLERFSRFLGFAELDTLTA